MKGTVCKALVAPLDVTALVSGYKLIGSRVLLYRVVPTLQYRGCVSSIEKTYNQPWYNGIMQLYVIIYMLSNNVAFL